MECPRYAHLLKLFNFEIIYFMWYLKCHWNNIDRKIEDNVLYIDYVWVTKLFHSLFHHFDVYRLFIHCFFVCKSHCSQVQVCRIMRIIMNDNFMCIELHNCIYIVNICSKHLFRFCFKQCKYFQCIYIKFLVSFNEKIFFVYLLAFMCFYITMHENKNVKSVHNVKSLSIVGNLIVF